MNERQSPRIETIVDDAANDSLPTSGLVPTAMHEARRFQRFHYRAQVKATIYPLSGQRNIAPLHCTMMTRDLSRGGVNLLHCEKLAPGQRIDVTLHDGTPRPVEVMWCRRLANRCYSLGCRFIKRAHVKATIFPLRRQQGQAPVQCLMLTRDLSPTGVNLMHCEQLFPGQQIEVVLYDDIARLVEVVWCRRLGNRSYAAGCRFIKPAPDEAPAPSPAITTPTQSPPASPS